MIPNTGKERRDRIWEIAVDLGSWSRKDLMRATGIKEAELQSILEDWGSSSHVETDGVRDGVAFFRCDPSVKSERVDRNVAGREIRDDGPQGNMWRAMRMTPRFTARDIAMVANTDANPIDEPTASKYAQMLAKAGYLRVVRKANARAPAVYSLVADTGPKPPVEKRVRCVWDQNKEALTHVPGEQVDV